MAKPRTAEHREAVLPPAGLRLRSRFMRGAPNTPAVAHYTGHSVRASRRGAACLRPGGEPRSSANTEGSLKRASWTRSGARSAALRACRSIAWLAYSRRIR